MDLLGSGEEAADQRTQKSVVEVMEKCKERNEQLGQIN